jgi:nitrite reductase/ring-hydroxylating ferredoxin subunit
MTEPAGLSPYPTGWFRVAYSDELPRAGVLPLRYFGQELVLFRTESGRAQVFGAFCAHLGAHIGYGGAVDGECVRCPFHGWRYDRLGQCVAIPYSEQIPRGAAVPVWPTEEASGVVYVWHDPAGGTPRWPAPRLEEYGQPSWSGYHRHQRIVKTQIAEVVENIFDAAHGQFVHQNDNGNSAATIDYDFSDDLITVTFLNDLPLVGGKTRHVVQLRELGTNINHAVGVGQKAFLTSYTPIDESTLDVHFAFLTPDSLPDDPTGETSRRSANATVALFEQDLPIWEHKRYQPYRKLCAGDGPIGRYRQWAKRFYEPARPPVTDVTGPVGVPA